MLQEYEIFVRGYELSTQRVKILVTDNMAALEEDDNLDDEIFQDTALLTFPLEVQSVLDDVFTLIYQIIILLRIAFAKTAVIQSNLFSSQLFAVSGLECLPLLF